MHYVYSIYIGLRNIYKKFHCKKTSAENLSRFTQQLIADRNISVCQCTSNGTLTLRYSSISAKDITDFVSGNEICFFFSHFFGLFWLKTETFFSLPKKSKSFRSQCLKI